MRTLLNKFKAVHAGIRIFDPMLFEDTFVSKIMKILIENAMLFIMKKSFFNKNNPWKLCFY